jgi:hypothetical protein
MTPDDRARDAALTGCSDVHSVGDHRRRLRCRPSGRTPVLTDISRTVYPYADEVLGLDLSTRSGRPDISSWCSRDDCRAPQ